jgi:hypothetical protein
VFLLQNQSHWLFRAWGFLGKAQSLRVRRECVVIVVSVFCVRRAPLRVAPHTIFQDGVPDEASTCETKCGVFANPRRINCPGKSCALLHGAQILARSASLRAGAILGHSACGCARAAGARKDFFLCLPGTSVPGYGLWRPLRGLVALRLRLRPDLHPATRSARRGTPGLRRKEGGCSHLFTALKGRSSTKNLAAGINAHSALSRCSIAQGKLCSAPWSSGIFH